MDREKIIAIRTFARRSLPESLRKPLGRLGGVILEHVVMPFEGLIFDLSGGRFRADQCVFVIPKDITRLRFRGGFLGRDHERDERYLASKFVEPEDSVLELGACLGVVSCIVNKRLRNQTRHVAVEANPFCLSALHRNRDLNHCGFLIENCAVSNQRDVVFFLDPNCVTGSTTERSTKLPVRVPGKSLQELVDRYGPFSVLIMDIEGGEKKILDASVDTLKKFRLVIVELHEWMIGTEGVNRCREILRKAGFEMVERSFITEAWKRCS